MFNVGSFEQELYESMQKAMVSNSQEKSRSGINKLAKATDLLNIAASIFDKAGMFDESDEISKILQSLVGETK